MYVHACGGLGLMWGVFLYYSSTLFIQAGSLSQTQGSLPWKVLLPACFGAPLSLPPESQAVMSLWHVDRFLGLWTPIFPVVWQVLQLPSHFSSYFTLFFWDRVFHWTWSTSFQLGWPANDLQDWSHRPLYLCLTLTQVLKDPNAGPLVCTADTVTEPFP